MTGEFEDQVIGELAQMGVSQEHIQLQKKNIFQETHVENYYDKDEQREISREDVPVEKIIGIKTNEQIVGKSVYDLCMDLMAEKADTETIADSLKEFKENQDFSPLHFDYYREDDCYIVENKGLQRMITAKMINTPFISGLVTIYGTNKEKKKYYEEFLSLKQLLRLTDIKGLTFELFLAKKID